MMTHLIQSALILTLFYAAYRILFERFTFFQHNRIFLLSGLGLSLALPFLPLNFSKERMEYVYLPKNYFENMPAEISVESNSSFFWQEWTFGDWIFSVYLVGVFVFSLIMIFQLIQISLLIGKGNLIRKDGMKLVLTDKTTSPFSFFNTIVMNPKMLSEEQLGHIVTHENIHISQWHQLDVVMAEVLKIVLWFFPVSWWYGKSIRTNLEFIADTNSLENGLDKKAYQLNLVSISQQPSGSVLVNNFSKKLIKHRIKMLNKMKTKKQILSFYAVLIPALVLISIGISVQAQSQNEKVKQVIVLSDEKIEPENVKVQIKDENGELQDLDSVNLKLISPQQAPLSVFINSNEEEKPGIGYEWNLRNPNWEIVRNTNPSTISSVNVEKENGKNLIIIQYKDGRKNDTITQPRDVSFGYSYEMKPDEKILSPKELKMKIQKGEIDLNDPKNEWLKVWKEKGFKEPIVYSSYHKLLENWDGGVYKKHEFSNPMVYNFEELQKIPDGTVIKIDTALFDHQKIFFKTGSATKTGVNSFSSDEMMIIPKNKNDKNEVKYWKRNQKKDSYTIPEISFQNEKKPKIYIDGKISTLKELKKLEKKQSHIIQYIVSDGKIEIEKYGSSVAKDGILLAFKRPSR